MLSEAGVRGDMDTGLETDVDGAREGTAEADGVEVAMLLQSMHRDG